MKNVFTTTFLLLGIAFVACSNGWAQDENNSAPAKKVKLVPVPSSQVEPEKDKYGRTVQSASVDSAYDADMPKACVLPRGDACGLGGQSSVGVRCGCRNPQTGAISYGLTQ
jgi:hypothetical protein